MSSSLPTDEKIYHKDKRYTDGSGIVWYCTCGAHVSEHANQEGPYEIRIDRTKWFCPIKKPQSDMDILRSMLR